jgi:hypothetical protein
MNSTGFAGFQSACAAPPNVAAMVVASNHEVFLSIVLPPCDVSSRWRRLLELAV